MTASYYLHLFGLSSMQVMSFSFWGKGASGSWAVALLACPMLRRGGWKDTPGILWAGAGTRVIENSIPKGILYKKDAEITGYTVIKIYSYKQHYDRREYKINKIYGIGRYQA
jgi:hypothetical protein